MKKIVFAIALFGIAFMQTRGQNPAAVSTDKATPAEVQVAAPALSAPKPASPASVKPAGKPARKVAPASVRKGKQVMHKPGKHGKKAGHVVKQKTPPAKPFHPVSDDKK
jgi:hypothetical protein